jgi:hypothetical protein
MAAGPASVSAGTLQSPAGGVGGRALSVSEQCIPRAHKLNVRPYHLGHFTS